MGIASTPGWRPPPKKPDDAELAKWKQRYADAKAALAYWAHEEERASKALEEARNMLIAKKEELKRVRVTLRERLKEFISEAEESK